MGATAGLALQFGGAAYSASKTRSAGKANEKLANYNADVADMQADDAIVRGQAEEGVHRLKVRGLIGAQRAAFAASGVDVNSGNSVEVQADTARMGEMDALTIRMNAAREAWGYKTSAQDSRARGQVIRQQADSQALGTIVTAAGSYASNRYGFGSTAKKG